MVNIKINGLDISVEPGTTVLEAARGAGIDIPTFCYDKDLTTSGACRICVVEIEGFRNLPASCSTAVSEVANHPVDCLTCEKTGACKLQEYSYRYGVRKATFQGEKKNIPIDDENHLIRRDQNKCILCGKCVRVCEEVQVTSAVDFTGRGFDTIVTTALNSPLSIEQCRFCGQCVDICPTGALVNKQIAGTHMS